MLIWGHLTYLYRAKANWQPIRAMERLVTAILNVTMN